MLKVLREATKHHPLVKWIWVLVGLVALASFALIVLGGASGAIMGVGLSIFALVLITLVPHAAKNKHFGVAALYFVALVLAFVTVFAGFTVSAFSISKPCSWVQFLDVPTNDCSELKIPNERLNISPLLKTMSGKVLYRSLPVSGVTVTLLRKDRISTVTNEQGLYTFEDIDGIKNDIIKFSAKKGELVDTGDLRIWSPDPIVLK